MRVLFTFSIFFISINLFGQFCLEIQVIIPKILLSTKLVLQLKIVPGQLFIENGSIMRWILLQLVVVMNKGLRLLFWIASLTLLNALK